MLPLIGSIIKEVVLEKKKGGGGGGGGEGALTIISVFIRLAHSFSFPWSDDGGLKNIVLKKSLFIKW